MNRVGVEYTKAYTKAAWTWRLGVWGIEVLPLLVAQHVELFAEDIQLGRDMIEAHVEEPDPPDLPRRRRGDERRHQEAERKGDEESDGAAHGLDRHRCWERPSAKGIATVRPGKLGTSHGSENPPGFSRGACQGVINWPVK
jgi:hypothetical protein